jgi:t-SNARE complex subunit (syntaxin)
MKMERNFSNSTKYNAWERILRESLEANSEELKRAIKETRRQRIFRIFKYFIKILAQKIITFKVKIKYLNFLEV